MPNKSGCRLKKQLSSPNLKCWTKCMLHKARIRLTHMKMKVGPSQRRIDICCNLCRKNIKNDLWSY